MRVREGLVHGGHGRVGATSPMVVAGALAAILLLTLALLFLLGGPFRNRGPGDAGTVAAPGPKPAGEEAPEKGRDEAVSRPSAAGAAAPAGEPADATMAEGEAGPGGVILGTVRVAGTRDPAPEVRVVLRKLEPATSSGPAFVERLQPPKLGEADLSAVSAKDGTWRVEAAAPGDWLVFVLAEATDFLSIPPSSGRHVTVPDSGDPVVVDIEVALGGVIRGKVTDGEGGPLPGAAVTAAPRDFFKSVFDQDSAFAGVREVKAGEGGSYRIAGLPLDGKFLVIAHAEAKARAISGEVSFPPGEREVEVDIELLEGSTVSGSVASSAGPASGAKVRVSPVEVEILAMQEPREVEADETGGFQVEHLSAGKYAVEASAPGAKPAKLEVECDGEYPVSGLVLILQPAAPGEEAKTLSGRVVDDAGSAVPGADIQLAGFVPGKGAVAKTATSAEDGAFAIEGLSKGVYSMTVQRQGFAPSLRSGVDVSAGPIEVVLQRVSRVLGRVVARATGEPVEGAVVKSVPSGGELEQMTRLMAGQLGETGGSTKTAADGSFALEKVTPGKLRIRAESARFAPAVSRELDVAPGTEVSGVSLSMSDGGKVRGWVLGPDAAPVADALVRASELTESSMGDQMRTMLGPVLSGDSGFSSRTDAAGAFELARLPEGRLGLVASHPDFAPSVTVEVSLGDGEGREGVELKLRRPGTIRVTARSKEKPLAGLMAQLLGSGPMKMATTDAEGKAEFGGVAPGDYLVQLLDVGAMMSGKGLGTKQKAASVGDGATVEVEFAFGVGATVRGKIRGELSGPMTIVTLRKPEGPAPETQNPNDFGASIRAATYNVGMGIVSPDGTYTIADVPDGEFILEIPRMPSDYSSLSRMKPEDMVPLHRSTIEVKGGRDVERDIDVGR